MMKMNRSVHTIMLIACLIVGLSCVGCEEVDAEESQLDPDALCEPKPAEDIEDCDIPLERNFRLEEVEDFEVFCESKCNRVTASIRVGPKISSLKPLKHIKYISGLSLGEANLDLKGELESLEEVYAFDLTNNDTMKRLEGLDKVRKVSIMNVESNTALEYFDAFSSLEEMDQTFRIADNPNLKYARVLPSIKEHREAIIIADNRRMERLEGLNDQASLAYLGLTGNRSLTDISGLKAPQKIELQLKIDFNERLPKCQVDAFVDGIDQGPELTVISDLDESATCAQ